MKIVRYNVRHMPSTVVDQINILVDEEADFQGRKVPTSYIIAKAIGKLCGKTACKSCYGLIPNEIVAKPPEYSEENKSIWKKIEKQHTGDCAWVEYHQTKAQHIDRPVEASKSNVVEVTADNVYIGEPEGEKVAIQTDANQSGKVARPSKTEIPGLTQTKENLNEELSIKVDLSNEKTPPGTDDDNPHKENIHPHFKSKNMGAVRQGGHPPVVRQDEQDRKSNDGLPDFI